MFVLVNKVPSKTSDVCNLQKVAFFHFYSTDLVNTKTTIPFRVSEQH